MSGDELIPIGIDLGGKSSSEIALRKTYASVGGGSGGAVIIVIADDGSNTGIPVVAVEE